MNRLNSVENVDIQEKLQQRRVVHEAFLCGSHQLKVFDSPDVSAAHCCLHQW